MEMDKIGEWKIRIHAQSSPLLPRGAGPETWYLGFERIRGNS